MFLVDLLLLQCILVQPVSFHLLQVCFPHLLLLITASPEEVKHVQAEHSQEKPAEDSQPSIEQVHWTERIVALLSIPVFKRSIEGVIFAFTTALLMEVMVSLLLLLIRVPVVLIELVPLLRLLPLSLVHLLHVFLKLGERISASCVAMIFASAEILEKLFSLPLELLLIVEVTTIVKGILIAFSISVCGFTSIVLLLLLLLL